MTKNISPKVINRFTLYFSILIDCIDNEIDYVSSKYISSILRIDQSQVRKDFQVLTSQGICNLGYYGFMARDSTPSIFYFYA